MASPRSATSYLFVLLILLEVVGTTLAFQTPPKLERQLEMTNSDVPSLGTSISVAHIGNSIQYYNDCPRLLQSMLNTHFDTVAQDSCLRGGASLPSLLEKGNGMRTKFATPNGLKPDGSYDIGSPTVEELLLSTRADFVIVNDHTQAPAREETKQATMNVLKESYLPLLIKAGSPTVIWLMTAAYRKHAKNSDDLGSFDEFTDKLKDGYSEYQSLVHNSKIAPVGLAFQYVKTHYPTTEDESFSWEKLYAEDDFHPSPHGTLLEAFVLYATIVGSVPPEYDPSWWSTARYMQPPDAEPLPLPSHDEGVILREVACQVCNVGPKGRESAKL